MFTNCIYIYNYKYMLFKYMNSRTAVYLVYMYTCMTNVYMKHTHSYIHILYVFIIKSGHISISGIPLIHSNYLYIHNYYIIYIYYIHLYILYYIIQYYIITVNYN